MSSGRAAIAELPPLDRDWAKSRVTVAWLTAALLVTVLALLPMYTRDSGGLQIVDGPIVLLATVVLFTSRLWWPGSLTWVGLTMVAYTLWMVTVEVVAYMLTGAPPHLLGMVQKTYALAMFWTFTLAFGSMLTLRSAPRIVLVGLTTAMTVVIGLGAGGSVIGGYRQSLSFNNPDQLAYFAILSAACVLIAFTIRSEREPQPIDWILGSFVVLGAHYLCFMSVSRSAIGGMVVLDAFLPFAILRRRSERRRLLVLLVAGAALLAGARAWSQNTTTVDRVAYLMRRFEGEAVAENLNRRLFVRFLEHRDVSDASELMFGTGKPNNSAVDVKEVHSAFGETLLEGGIVGLALLIAFLGSVLALQLSGSSPRRERLLHAGVLAAVALYNLFQVGTRFRMFWLFLAFTCAVVIHNEGVEARRRRMTGAGAGPGE